MRRILAQAVGRPGHSRRSDGGRTAGPGERRERVLWGWHLSQWGVFAFGIVVVLIVLGPLTQRPGVHWMRTQVSFVAPASVAAWQQDLPTDASLVPFAAAVQRAVTGGPEHRFSADEATLHAFASHATSVRLADSGGQWVHAFNRPTLIVEVVDPDPGRAAALMQEQLRQVRLAATELQEERGIASTQRIVVSVDESDEEHAVPSRGQLLRAGVITLAVGGVLSLLAAAAAGGPYEAWRRRARGGHSGG